MKKEKRHITFFLAFCFPFIASSQNFTIVISSSNNLCNGDNNGSAGVAVTGGSPPYTYLWTDPSAQTTATASGLSAGTYSVTITDAASADSAVSVTITEPPPVSISLEKNDIDCSHTKGDIVTAVAGGVSPYTYLWSNGKTTASISNLAKGGYTLTVTDNNGCTASGETEVREIPCDIFAALIFTPNGDGINDVWSVTGTEYFENFLLVVFDRWGQKVFEQEGAYTSWDGRSFFGIPVPDASYYYVIYLDRKNKDEIRKGTVTIVR